MEKIKELKNRVFALYEIVDFLVNLGNYEYADDIADEIKEIEKLIEEIEKDLKGVGNESKRTYQFITNVRKQ